MTTVSNPLMQCPASLLARQFETSNASTIWTQKANSLKSRWSSDLFIWWVDALNVTLDEGKIINHESWLGLLEIFSLARATDASCQPGLCEGPLAVCSRT